MESCGHADLGYLPSKQMPVCFLKHLLKKILLTGEALEGW